MVIGDDPQIISSSGALEIIKPVAMAQVDCRFLAHFPSSPPGCYPGWAALHSGSLGWCSLSTIEAVWVEADHFCRKPLPSFIEVHSFKTHYIQINLNLEDEQRSSWSLICAICRVCAVLIVGFWRTTLWVLQRAIRYKQNRLMLEEQLVPQRPVLCAKSRGLLLLVRTGCTAVGFVL